MIRGHCHIFLIIFLTIPDDPALFPDDSFN